MYCASCGKQIADGDAFCPHCGVPTQQSDVLAKLVSAARIGDQGAVSALYEKTYSKVYYTVKSMIKDEDAVFDIVQDTYIKAFAHLGSFQGDVKFLSWVRQIAANTARDWLKKKRPMLFTEMNSGDGQDTPVEELFPDERSENLPDLVIDRQETKRLIHEIIEELPEDQRAAIGMFYYEEMSVKEIAAAMGVSESAVKSRLMYGRDKIEKKVLELEKQGTKLYSLAPLPFLLLLFRSQEAYAAEVPNSQILQAILASQPMGSAPTAGVMQDAAASGGAAGTEAAGAATAGTAAAGGLGALKIGLIALAAAVAVILGAFVAVRIYADSAKPQESLAIEDVVDEDEPGAPAEDSQSAEETESSDGEDSRSAEKAEEEVSVSYIFSDMPIAAYEVTGLGIGRFESVNEEEIFVEETEDAAGYHYDSYSFNAPLVRLTPGENTFILFCMQGDEEGEYSVSEATIHSPSGNSQWEAITYVCLYTSFKTIGDFSIIERPDTNSEYTTYLYNEETYGGGFNSITDPVGKWVKFAEIYHPDSPQDDAIYVIDVIAYSGANYGYDEIDNVLVTMTNTFEELGATTVKEIPVEEALKRCNAVVSEGDAD